MNAQQIKYICLIACLLLASVSCTSTAYYLQALDGHMDLLIKKQAISNVLLAQDTDEELRKNLELVIELREFADDYLGLPHKNSYTDYADLGREFVVWNVFATPEFSLEPKQWCFLFVGCLNYRGYYSEAAASTYAQKLKTEGYDVFVGGVTAYSTLGWFDDPVLNTMLGRHNNYLASVIFHELAHQKIYLKNDTAFNEAFAETVAYTGVQNWLELHGTAASLQDFIEKRLDEESFITLILDYKDKLESVYNSALTLGEKREEKKLLLNQLLESYEAKKPETGANSISYSNWLSSDLNNAKLATVITYQDYVSGFLAIFNKDAGNYQRFYDSIAMLSQCGLDKRKFILENNITDFQC